MRQDVDEHAQALDAQDLNSADGPEMGVSAASKALELDPQYAPAHRLLGRALLEEAAFDKAAAAFRRSLELEPRNPQAEKGLAEALRLAGVARSLPLHLKRGQRLLALVETPRDSQDSVFALIGTWQQWEETGYVRRPEVRLFVSHQGRYQETFRTTDVAWGGHNEIDYYRAWVADLLGMGSQQIILVSGWLGADHFREVLDVFRPEGRSLRHIVHVAGEVPGGGSPFEVKDLDGDGRREIEVWTMLEYFHANCADWCDVFKYDGRRYRLATRRFPDVVRENVSELESWREFCREEGASVEPEVLEYLARGHRYLRDLEKASHGKARPRSRTARP